jgi:hypothetical protein
MFGRQPGSSRSNTAGKAAARMVHSFQVGGKMDSYNVWLSIMMKVDELTLHVEQNSATSQ